MLAAELEKPSGHTLHYFSLLTSTPVSPRKDRARPLSLECHSLSPPFTPINARSSIAVRAWSNRSGRGLPLRAPALRSTSRKGTKV